MDDTLKIAMYEWGQEMVAKMESDKRIIDVSEAGWDAWQKEVAKIQVCIYRRVAALVKLKISTERIPRFVPGTEGVGALGRLRRFVHIAHSSTIAPSGHFGSGRQQSR